MAEGTIRVSGLRETVAVLNKVSRNAPKVVTDELQTAAIPVKSAADMRVSRYQGTTQKFRTRVKGRGSVYVEGTARRRTGKRRDFGRLQQRHLEIALDEKQNEVRNRLEKALDRLTSEI